MEVGLWLEQARNSSHSEMISFSFSAIQAKYQTSLLDTVIGCITPRVQVSLQVRPEVSDPWQIWMDEKRGTRFMVWIQNSDLLANDTKSKDPDFIQVYAFDFLPFSVFISFTATNVYFGCVCQGIIHFKRIRIYGSCLTAHWGERKQFSPKIKTFAWNPLSTMSVVTQGLIDNLLLEMTRFWVALLVHTCMNRCFEVGLSRYTGSKRM